MADDTNLQSLENQLPDLRASAEHWRSVAGEATRKADGYDAIIRGIERVIGAPGASAEASAPVPQVVAADSNGDAGPRGIAAVRQVVLESPERIWKAQQIHSILHQRGWLSTEAQFPLRGTEAAINRLVHRGELERVDRGRYRATDRMKGEPQD